MLRLLLIAWFSLFWGLVSSVADSSVNADATAISNSIHTDSAIVSLIVPPSKQSEHSTTFGLKFDLKPHWKIYWKNPGDAGYAPSITIKNTKNQVIHDVNLHFPVPKAMELLGMHSYAYENKIVFPVTIGKKNNVMSPLFVTVEWLACNRLCVPYEGTLPLSLDIPSDAQSEADTAILNTWMRQVPTVVDNPQGITATLSPDIQSDKVQKNTLKNPYNQILTVVSPLAKEAFLYHDDFPSMTPIEQVTTGDKTVFTYALSGDISLRKPLYITLIQPEGQPDTIPYKITENTVFISQTVPQRITQNTSLLWGMVLAFLGGLILNFMPCVLPVLGIKALAFVNENTMATRLSFLWTCVGIIGSFAIIGGLVYGLKAAGNTIGWGIHFQNPLFLWGMFAVMTVFALMLITDTSLPLPAKVRGVSPGKSTPVGNIFNGMLATVLSTPCSAPILGSAITLIISLQGWVIVILFMVMGVGMAFPYLVIAMFPKCLSIIPKPGAWMHTFRRIMGVLVALTALWLGWLAVGVTLPNAFLSKSAQQTANNQSKWQPFEPTDESVIHNAVARGQVVLLDITADWCLTCQLNKVTTLETDNADVFYQQNKVLLLRKDWTHKDDTVPLFLAKYGRHAIPFNVVYGPNAPQGIVLREILTPMALKEAIQKAQ